MQIIEIREPGEFEVSEDTVVGIDFGTTNSLIAISKDYNSQIIKMSDGSELVPSVICVMEEKIGVNNYDAKKYIRSIKRLLAKSSEEIKNTPNLMTLASDLDLSAAVPRVKIGKNYLSLPEVASEIFKYLKSEAELSLDCKLKKAVVSVPAYFDDNARGQVLFAARLAGLEVIRLISEPTAAAYAYGLNQQQEGAYLVYDLGGGTFDVSILNMRTGVLQVVATGGDNMLGGDDIDILLAHYMASQMDIEINSEIIFLAKKAKEDLSSRDSIEIIYEDNKLAISRNEFEELVLPVVEKTVKVAKDTLYDADNIDLDGIILVGGSTRMPLISDLLTKSFKTEIYSDQDPDKIVALGAALQAENLSAKPKSLLIDVLSLSVGLEVYGGIAEKIILRNTPIPFSITQEFTTHSDNQTGMQFHIVQGEREMAKDCRSLARFELNGIPLAKAGKGRVEVVFAIDADGILSVTAREAITGKIHAIEVKPSYGMSEEEVFHALKIAYENVAKDHKERLLVEAKERAYSLITGLEKAIEETPWLLTENEKIKIDKAISSLQKAVILDNQEDILIKIDGLNSLATVFIQKHLDKGVDMHLKGMHINEIK
ncbi:Chaperone protein HscA [Candidatus Megaera venefica]|uniref:Chaperone protein HscA n=1 Tax=Candidatus Megaera venefica TaxID=2055910 RepID=A0ABU5NDV2_9RICK|nr:Hsp70 family protein [Candidatus Megaera venefica]MEA0971344.1 Chaperone protein HscA [Candidatus Megaera venefica]